MEVKPGYKQTAVGVIPEEWDAKQIRDVCTLVNGRGFKPHEWQTVGLPIIRIQNLNGSEDFNFYTGQYNSKILIEHGQLLFAWSGSRGTSFGPHVWGGGRALLNYHTWKVVVNESKADADFLLHALRQLTSFIEDRAHGASALVHTQKWEMEKFPLPIPSSLLEQRAIATALSDVDALLGALDRLIAKKRDLKQAAMQQLLTGQTRLPGFHGEWTRLNMAENSTLKARIGWQGLTTAEYLKTGEYFLVTGTDFSNGCIAWSNCCFVEAQRYTQDRNIQLRPGDILLTKDGTIGKVAFIDVLRGPATLNSGVFVIRPKDAAYNPRFFFYVLTSHVFDEFLTRLQAGSTITHLYQKDFVNFSFLAPETLAEQTAIAAVLTEMDAELAALEQRREKTRALKQGMMQELLTGRIRLL
jgi:type I restriction enzyme S subunit